MGDTISEEDFNKLGDAYSDYFELQNDGTYKLIANAEDLKAIIDGIDTQKALEGMQSEAGKMN